ncbi:cysteine synthase A [Hydrocarboniclastica marina]|uniref:Cysteine synthase n=1 Tax=Hydrocarboniclastica marina TaxID=2259620 RepID=A0A4P7XK34_9ALTE|nr:cysteine synthase A [Hydrocarboniclastica marina]QCF26257.1 cysteine synthase A [Hydrocarboniclastica marina]
MGQIYEDNSFTIGKTPLVRLNKVNEGATIWAKIEGRNPTFSVKCRIGSAMVWEAEKDGRLTAGKTIIEATSGNTGIALAYVAAARGYKLILTMPASMSLERRKVLKALGAELELTEPAKGMPGAIARAEQIMAENPDAYFMPRQFDNPANPGIHETTTGPEIWDDTDGAADVLVAGVGTGGTLTGVARYFKNSKGKPLHVVAVEPEASPVITQTMEGQEVKAAPHKIQGIGAGFIPPNLDLSLVNSVQRVSNEDAMAMAHRLMREEGIMCGISCGAAAVAAVRVSQLAEMKGKNIVVILPDSAERYLSSALFADIFSKQELEQ